LKYGAEEINLLRLLIFLNPDGVLIEFLQLGSQGLDEELRQIIQDKMIFYEALECLQAFSLVKRSQRKERILIHRLIQAVIKDELSETEKRIYFDRVIRICTSAIPKKYDYEMRPVFRKIRTEIVGPLFEAAGIVRSEPASDTTQQFGQISVREGRFQDGEAFLKLSNDITLTLFGTDHPGTWRATRNLARTYYYGDRFQEAADLLPDVLEWSKKNMGEEHPDTFTAMIFLADSHICQGYLTKARDLYSKILETNTDVLDKDSWMRRNAISGLARVYEG
jgi:tetratricopeptide (TPR) repeat protein